MRLRVQLHLEREAHLPFDHQEHLAGLVYRLLALSDGDYARFLHDEGFRLGNAAGEGTKRFKLFVFSNLRIPRERRRPEGACLRIAPGPVEWLIASPREEFLTHSATGLFAVGRVVQVGHIPLTITGIEALPEPVFQETMRFTCLTAMVASVPRKEGPATYLRPADGEKFSDYVRRNLLRKYELIYERPPDAEGLPLRLEFDRAYLSDLRRRGGTKKCTFKGIDIVGAYAPFTLTGAPALMEIGWHCGFGEKNSLGFGMVEVDRAR